MSISNWIAGVSAVTALCALGFSVHTAERLDQSQRDLLRAQLIQDTIDRTDELLPDPYRLSMEVKVNDQGNSELPSAQSLADLVPPRVFFMPLLEQRGYLLDSETVAELRDLLLETPTGGDFLLNLKTATAFQTRFLEALHKELDCILNEA